MLLFLMKMFDGGWRGFLEEKGVFERSVVLKTEDFGSLNVGGVNQSYMMNL